MGDRNKGILCYQAIRTRFRYIDVRYSSRAFNIILIAYYHLGAIIKIYILLNLYKLSLAILIFRYYKNSRIIVVLIKLNHSAYTVSHKLGEEKENRLNYFVLRAFLREREKERSLNIIITSCSQLIKSFSHNKIFFAAREPFERKG